VVNAPSLDPDAKSVETATKLGVFATGDKPAAWLAPMVLIDMITLDKRVTSIYRREFEDLEEAAARAPGSAESEATRAVRMD